MFNGKIHYFDWAIFNCKLLVHQRVMFFAGAEIRGFSEEIFKG